jgi:hypothetical protein
MLNVHHGYGRLRVESLIPGSFVFDLLKEKQIEGLFLLTINGIEICTLTDVMAILDDVYEKPEPMTHILVTGFTFLFGKLDSSDSNLDQLSSEQHYHAVSRSVFSLCLEAFADDNGESTISNELACHFLDMEEVDPDFIAEIWSILQTTTNPTCPRSFKTALKEPIHRGKWIAAFYQHLDSSYALGTYGSPKLLPGDATVFQQWWYSKLFSTNSNKQPLEKFASVLMAGYKFRVKTMTNPTRIRSFLSH